MQADKNSGIVDVINDTTDFWEDSIGQYSNPNPTVMNVQIFPNPATNNITVQFPVAINEMMHVKITNVMGYIYFENDVHVAGNVLNIPIQSFPTGMYYIVCTGNGGMAFGYVAKCL